MSGSGCRKRSRGIEKALNRFSPDLIILDDAFQHRSVYRNCDILLLSVNQKLSKDHLLPLGNLREPLKNLKRADIYIITGLNDWEDRAGEVVVNNLQILFKSYTRCVGYVMADLILKKDLSMLHGKSAVAFCGIANPNSFHTLLKSLHINVIEFYVYPDHHRYRSEDFQRLQSSCMQTKCDYIITTEKDLVKWKTADQVPSNLLALSVKTEFADEELIRQKIQTILDKKTKNA